MKKLESFFLTGFIAVMCLTSENVNAQNPSEFCQSFVEVTGYAEKEVSPDRFYMRIEINEFDSKGKKSVEDQQREMVKALKSIDIDTDKQLTRLSLQSSYYKRNTNRASATYQLKLESAEQVSKVWKAMDELGISGVSFQKAEYSRMEELKNEVRQEAVRNAKSQASSMAEAIGQTIGKCFYMYCGQTSTPAFYAQPRMTKAVMYNAMADEMAVAEEESIEFNNIKLSMTVSTKFVLE